jgi:hypothetical protein
MKELW